ncbi:hypothetical protein N7510_006426 [Penicillium lagena]|uniref:uncharacterized protein n=1 Tax=Penicillium lagena TaxID=94218 RepID=UPI002540F192|nr:uncharacterized protein N7510_006426 [Penicillium lagena]KAJ5613232.1 hypothetical protein N7510_006426 [Penicillium lagena]
MALGAPITVISVEYRLSPAYLYPIPLEDGWNATQYIMSNLSSLVQIHTTPVNLVVSGTSSGGQLAAIVSHRAGSWLSAAENSTHAAKISFNGVLLRAPVSVRGTDTEFIPPRFRDLHRSWSSDYTGAELDRMSMIRNHGKDSLFESVVLDLFTAEALTVFLDALGVPFNKLTSPDAYPLWSEFSGSPRAYIQICELDILRDDAVCYVRGLRDAGVERPRVPSLSTWFCFPPNAGDVCFWILNCPLSLTFQNNSSRPPPAHFSSRPRTLVDPGTRRPFLPLAILARAGRSPLHRADAPGARRSAIATPARSSRALRL